MAPSVGDANSSPTHADTVENGSESTVEATKDIEDGQPDKKVLDKELELINRAKEIIEAKPPVPKFIAEAIKAVNAKAIERNANERILRRTEWGMVDIINGRKLLINSADLESQMSMLTELSGEANANSTLLSTKEEIDIYKPYALAIVEAKEALDEAEKRMEELKAAVQEEILGRVEQNRVEYAIAMEMFAAAVQRSEQEEYSRETMDEEAPLQVASGSTLKMTIISPSNRYGEGVAGESSKSVGADTVKPDEEHQDAVESVKTEIREIDKQKEEADITAAG
ncbi:hypothetical protein C8R46DRAFT_1045946 [Mycena filopes]|nr:hypothetical protein C8R46DRAFT_1045946 [Mycena filopes]